MHGRNSWVKNRDVKRQETLGETDGAERELETANLIESETKRSAWGNASVINLAVLDVTVNKSSELGF